MLTPTVADVIRVVDAVAPPSLAASWDNCGLQVGDVAQPVHHVMVALDPSLEVAAAAVADGADLLVTHHPLLIAPIKTIDTAHPPGDVIALALRHKLAIFAAHTNLDAAADGLNALLAARIGLEHPALLAPSDADACAGLGRVGALPAPESLEALCHRVKDLFGLRHLRMVGDPSMQVRRVAVCGGSGGSLLGAFFNSDAQVFITGDVRYHDARAVEERKRGIIDMGHFNSEQLVVPFLRTCLQQGLGGDFPGVTIRLCGVEKDPFRVM